MCNHEVVELHTILFPNNDALFFFEMNNILIFHQFQISYVYELLRNNELGDKVRQYLTCGIAIS